MSGLGPAGGDLQAQAGGAGPMRAPRWSRVPGLLLVLLVFVPLLCLAACGRGPSSENAENGDGPRIVSLVPAATLTLVRFGLADRIVGVGEHDPAADELLPRSMPRVGSFLDVDHERLAALQPTAVVVPRGTGLRLPTGAEAVEIEHPKSFADIARNTERLARLRGPENVDANEAWVAMEVPAAPADAPRTLMAFGTSPVWASGPGTVNDEALRAAGGVNALADAAVPAIALDEEALRALAPEVVLLLLPGASRAQARDGRAKLRARLPAARIEVLTEPFVLLPGPNVADTVRLFRETLHAGPQTAAGDPDEPGGATEARGPGRD